MRRARAYSSLEQHDVITAEHIRDASRADIVRFLRDFRGGSWLWLRSRPRAELEAMATKTAETWNAACECGSRRERGERFCDSCRAIFGAELGDDARCQDGA